MCIKFSIHYISIKIYKNTKAIQTRTLNMSQYDTLWTVKDGSSFVPKTVANEIYKMMVVKDKFMYNGTHNGHDARDVLLFRLKQEFAKLGYHLVDGIHHSVLEVSISLNLFIYV